MQDLIILAEIFIKAIAHCVCMMRRAEKINSWTFAVRDNMPPTPAPINPEVAHATQYPSASALY